MFILFRPIKSREDITRHCLIALAGALIITLVILAIVLTTSASFLSAQNDAIKARRQLAEFTLRTRKVPMGAYERVPGGWRNVESGLVYKDGK
jgi:hypothetical protein